MNPNDDDNPEASHTNHGGLDESAVRPANAKTTTYTYDPECRLEAVTPATGEAGDAALPQTVTAYVYENDNLTSLTVTKRTQ